MRRLLRLVLTGILIVSLVGISKPASALTTADWLPFKVGDGLVEVGCTWDNGCDDGYHNGSLGPAIDFIASVGTDVYAAGDGMIVGSYNSCHPTNSPGCSGSRGNYIEIAHADGRHSRYLHLSSVVKGSGIVKRGDLIGHVGNSGGSPVAHLHYDETVDNVKVDPGPMFARHGTSLVQYPAALDSSYTSWTAIPSWNDKFVRNDSYDDPSPPPLPPPPPRVGARVGNVLYSTNVGVNWSLISNTAAQNTWKIADTRTALLDTNGLWVSENGGGFQLWGGSDVQEFQITSTRVVARVNNLLYSATTAQQWELVSNTASAGNWQLSGNSLALLDGNGLWQKVGGGSFQLVSNTATTSNWKLAGDRLGLLDANGLWVKDGLSNFVKWRNPGGIESFQVSPYWVAVQGAGNLYVSAVPDSWTLLSNTATTTNWQLSNNRFGLLDANGLWSSNGNGGFTLVSNTATQGNWKVVGNRMGVLDANGLWVRDGDGSFQLWGGSDVVEFNLG